MNELVWYASYGSNLHKKRFLCYLQGGSPEFSTKCYKGCSDKSTPLHDETIIIPHQLYFAKPSSQWENMGVAFIKSKRNESVKTLGRMYLIKKGQFSEVVRQENGREPDDPSVNIDIKTTISSGMSLVPDIKRYGRILYLGSKGNYPIFTFTAKWTDKEIELNPPGEKYLKIISRGLKETYKYPNERIIEYLKNSDGIKGQIEEQEISRIVESIISNLT